MGGEMEKIVHVFAMAAAAVMPAVMAATFGVRQIAGAGGPLEPSVRNEVDHAVARAEAWLATAGRDGCGKGVALGVDAADAYRLAAGDLFGTNGLDATAIALKLVSSQKGGGWWIAPTNAAPTVLAVEILKGL